MAGYTERVEKLIEEFGKLPGIGRKTAERLAEHILRVSEQEALSLADAICDVKQNVRRCSTCYNLAEGELCDICTDTSRDRSVICVVEQARDVLVLEKPGTYRGLYHVLGGRIAPLEGIGPEELTIDKLIERVRAGGVKEVILATNPTVEGDTTALYIKEQLEGFDLRITRLARGVATGMVLEFANKDMLADALAHRQPLK